MPKEIKQRIVLEGEKQYNQAIRDAQRNLKTLKSELKAETAELGKNATEQQKAEAKAKSLRAQIAEQEKIVKVLRTALSEVKEKYGDNADEVAKWEQRLNNARTTLANMRQGLDDVGQGFKGINTDAAAATVATKSVADAMDGIGKAGEKISQSIENFFLGIVQKAADAVADLWGLVTDTAAKANNFTDLARYYGSSAQEIQMWSRSIEAAGGSFSNFTAIVNRLAYGGNEKKITELLGISKENYDDDIQYTLAVMDALERRKQFMGQSAFDETVSEIFGAKKSADVNWFLSNAYGHRNETTGEWINGWRENPERFNGNETGYGMSDEELGTMNDLYIRLQNIEEKWNALKDNFAAGFGTAALKLAVNVEGTLDGIAEYMSAETDAEREAALKKIRENVEEFFRKLGEIIRDSIHIIKDVGMELQESDDPLTRAIGDIMVKLAEGLEWLVDHQEEVKGALEAIFGVWLLGQLAAVAGKLSSILLQIQAIQAFKGLNLANAGANAAGNAGASAAGEAAGGAAGAGLGTKLAAGASNLFWTAGVPALVLAAGLLPSYYAQKWNEEQWREEQNERFAAADRIEQMYGGVTANSDFIRRAAEEVGLKHDENGNEKLDVTGKFTQTQNTQDLRTLLMGLSDRQGIQMAQLERDINTYGRYTELGDNTWTLLNRYWNGEAIDAVQENALLETIADAMIKADEERAERQRQQLPEDWTRTTSGWGGMAGGSGGSGDSSGMLREMQDNMVNASERGVRNGIRGLKVEIDGQAAGRILAPYVSQEIARDMTQ